MVAMATSRRKDPQVLQRKRPIFQSSRGHAHWNQRSHVWDWVGWRKCGGIVGRESRFIWSSSEALMWPVFLGDKEEIMLDGCGIKLMMRCEIQYGKSVLFHKYSYAHTITIRIKIPKQKLSKISMNPIALFQNCTRNSSVNIVPLKR